MKTKYMYIYTHTHTYILPNNHSSSQLKNRKYRHHKDEFAHLCLHDMKHSNPVTMRMMCLTEKHEIPTAPIHEDAIDQY